MKAELHEDFVCPTRRKELCQKRELYQQLDVPNPQEIFAVNHHPSASKKLINLINKKNFNIYIR